MSNKKPMKDRKKHILVISQYFYPEQFRINDICGEWIKKGYEVTVITGIPNYPTGKYYQGYGLFKKRKEQYSGISIIRLPLIPRGNSAIMLALNYLSFVVSGFVWKTVTKIKANFVFIYEVSPMTQALPGIWYGKRRKIPCYLYVTDLWPENVAIITGINNKVVIGAIGKMVDYIYRRCDMIFTSSRSFIQSIQLRGVEKKRLAYWPQYAEDFYRQVELEKGMNLDAVIPQDEALNIIFAGNVGRAQGLEILPGVAKILKNKDLKVRFNIVGDGRYKDDLLDLVKKLKVDEMFNFINKQPPEEIPYYMAMSDVALISLAKSEVFALTIPAKTQSCLACGIPIIVSADGEIQSIIKEAEAGLCSDAGDSNGLARIIERFCTFTKAELLAMGENGKKYSENNFAKEMLLNQMDEYF